MLSRICLACERANAPDAKFCSECGAPLQLKLCRHCHKANDYEAHFCQSCGRSLPHSPSEPAEVPPAVAPMGDPAVEKNAAVPPVQATENGGTRSAPAIPTIVKAFAPSPAANPPPASLPEAPEADATTAPAAAQLIDALPQTAYGPPALFDPPAHAQAHRGVAGRRFVGGALLLLAVAATVLLTVGRTPTPPRQSVEPEPRPATAQPEGSVPPSSSAAAAAALPVDVPAEIDRTDPPTSAAPIQAEEKAPPAPAAARRPSPSADSAAPRPVASPRPAPLRECTPDLAALGLCTIAPPTEGK